MPFLLQMALMQFTYLKMLGIGRGDEVITTAHSWISTSETISQTEQTNFVDTNEFLHRRIFNRRKNY